MVESFYYSGIALFAILMLVMQNYEILLKPLYKIENKVWKDYKKLLYSIILFHMTDVVWGIFDAYKITQVLFIDSLFYFGSMSLCVLFWTRYAVIYIDDHSIWGRILRWLGEVFYVTFTVMVLVNVFRPVIFSIDENGGYHVTNIRWVMHGIQILLLVSISVFGFAINLRKTGSIKKRYRTVAWFGLVMSIFLFVQLWFPLLPLYTIGYMLGICMVKTFVVNDEKEEYRIELEQSLEREKQHLSELQNTREVAYKDPLTGVKSKVAYAEFESRKDIQVREGSADEFAIAVFDINGLKKINDNFGHKKGDEYIKSACGIISEVFENSPVFRIGGDEFVAVLKDNDFENRKELENTFNERMNRQKSEGQVVVAMGMTEYRKEEDYTFEDVFSRADQNMYLRKHELKG
ncbi:MAG: GGDEF domain-containing protein [Eubacterium sp.]|nr:GGDEF domain-containing protein [Eubacterium sp.]